MTDPLIEHARLSEIMSQWLAFREQMCVREAIAPSTLANQRQIVGTLDRALGSFRIDELRKSHLDLYVADRLRICKPVTVDAEMAVLRQIRNWALDEKLIADFPRLPTVSVPNREKALPSDEDYAWYLRTLPPKDAAALQFMLLTGLAPHELERLQVRDHDPVRASIHIGARADFRVKQESRRREIPLNHRAEMLWCEWAAGRAAEAHPFPKAGALQKAMRRHFLARSDAPAAADGLTPKMMRKWFASKIALEHSEAVLQRLLGHAPGSPITRRHYVRVPTDALQGAVESLQ